MFEPEFLLSTPYSFTDDVLPEDFRGISVVMQATASFGDSEAVIIDTKKNQDESIFVSNFQFWEKESSFKSVDNFASSFFDAIVRLGKDAVPFIYRELQKGPTPLVHALDIIYEGEVNYKGYLPLDFICATWLEILKSKGISA